MRVRRANFFIETLKAAGIECCQLHEQDENRNMEKLNRVLQINEKIVRTCLISPQAGLSGDFVFDKLK